MTVKDVFILAVLQGVTEFLPISSSGHLVIMQNILGLENVPVLFDLILHLGTVIATVVVYYNIIRAILKDIFLWLARNKKVKTRIALNGNIKLAFFIIISTIMTGITGIIFKSTITAFFYKPQFLPLFFTATGAVLFGTKFVKNNDRDIGDLYMHHPVIIGGVQAVSMFPGISRSGSTIAAGLYMGMSREFSGSFSFLLSIPSIFGASLVEFMQTRGSLPCTAGPSLAVLAFFISFFTGYWALKLLLTFLKKGKLYIFSFYCFTAAISWFIVTTVV